MKTRRRERDTLIFFNKLMKTESSSLRHITSKKMKTHALLATVSPHLSCFNGPGFIKASVVKHPPFLKKKYTYVVGFLSLSSSEGHDTKKQHNNVAFFFNQQFQQWQK